MKHMIFQKRNFIMLLIMMSLLLFPKEEVNASEQSMLLLEGVLETDVVEIYKIADYDEEANSYRWTAPVEEWIEEKGQAYKSLTPERMHTIPETRAKEFTNLLLIGLQTSLDGIDADVSETGKTEYEIQLDTGFYLILPVGTTRIYSLKWFQMKPDMDPLEPIDIFYRGADQLSDMTEEDIPYDYDIPVIQMECENLVEERDYEAATGDGEYKEETNAKYAIDSDQMKITGSIKLPIYPDTYATEKRLNNIYVAIPSGVQYIEDSLEVTIPVAESEEEMEILNPDLYAQQILEEATVYEYQGKPLFFQIEGWYYNPDGSTLIADATDLDALQEYLKKHGMLEEEESEVSQDDLSEEITEEVSEEVSEGLTLENLEILDHWKIFIFSLETEYDWEEVDISYRVNKNEECNETGIYPCITGLLYSVSPLNTSLRGYITNDAEIDSLGIMVTVVKGTSYSKYYSSEELLEKEDRLEGAEFSIYRFTGNIVEQPVEDTDDVADSGLPLEDIQEESKEMVTEPERIVYYPDADDRLKEYELVAIIATDEKGVAKIGGLTKDEYLIKETKFPFGHTYAAEAYLITKEAWDDVEFMEGKHVASLIWLDYETVYLPATGKRGIGEFVMMGVLFGTVALSGMAVMLYKETKSLKEMIRLKNEYLEKEKITNQICESKKGEIL